jgi:hypothetical protein
MRQIQEPSIDSASLEDWQTLIQKTTIQGGGFMLLGLKNLDNWDAPAVLQGSRLELNGSFYKSESDEDINGSPSTGQNYIYAVQKSGNVSFSYSSTSPQWSVEKGGWYSGNDRAVAKVYYVTSQYNNKVILDSYDAMYKLNERQTLASTGGTLIITGTVNEVKKTTLAMGFYRLEIRAGTGGWGGYGSDYSGRCAGAAGEAKSESFILTDGSTGIYYAVGGDGNDGESSAIRYGYLGGGGGCSGGSSFVKTPYRSIICIGGSGGPGYYDAGGGGGGGFGLAEGGSLYSSAGMGGNNGVGGQGGSWNNMGGGGGSGYLSGGVGGNNASSGGSYGGSGGNGSNNYGATEGKGGAGGASRTGENIDPTDKNNTLRIQYQGGGGSGNYLSYGSAGGSGLKATSSGYVRIYRLG